jgi:hypothetical protein
MLSMLAFIVVATLASRCAIPTLEVRRLRL